MEIRGDNIYVNIKELPALQQISNGDSIVVESDNELKLIKFEDFIIYPENTTFYGEITQNLTYIKNLSTNVQTLCNNIYNYPTINGGIVTVGNYSELLTVTSQGRGWRWINTSNNSTFGSLVIQGTTDRFVSSFVDAMSFNTAGTVTCGNGLYVGSNIAINRNTLVDRQGYIDFKAQPGSDADARIYRAGGANGDLTIQNGGSGNLNVYTGGLSSQPWTANKGFVINGVTGHTSFTNSLVIPNNERLIFTDTAGTNPFILVQDDNYFTWWGTNSTGGGRPIFTTLMRSDTSPLVSLVPFRFGGDGTPITSLISGVVLQPGFSIVGHGSSVTFVTITGAVAGNAAFVTLGAGGSGSGFINVVAHVSSANIVAVIWQNISNSTQTLPDFYYRVTVINY